MQKTKALEVRNVEFDILDRFKKMSSLSYESYIDNYWLNILKDSGTYTKSGFSDVLPDIINNYISYLNIRDKDLRRHSYQKLHIYSEGLEDVCFAIDKLNRRMRMNYGHSVNYPMILLIHEMDMVGMPVSLPNVRKWLSNKEKILEVVKECVKGE